MRTLFDLLACPACKGDLQRSPQALRCVACALDYPIVDGVPVLLPGAPTEDLVPRFESDLPPRPGYSMWKERLLIASLDETAAVLDFGCGYQALDDPNIVRMDACLHPYADVVGDVHHLPLRSGSVQLAFGGAVFEHLKNPWQAARELARVLCPGGYLYADWNFVFAYHGYPAHYFNASRDGVREVFAAVLDIVETGVAPFQGPGAALRQVVGTYLAHAVAGDAAAASLREQLETVLLYPLEELDRAFAPADRHRVAAGIHVVACKPGHGPDAVIRDEVWTAWHADPQLQQRYPDPRRLAEPDNIVRSQPARRLAPRPRPTFSKDGTGRARHAMVGDWPDALLEEAEPAADAELRRTLLARRRPMHVKVRDVLATPGGVARLPLRAVRWLTWRVRHLLGQAP